MFKHAFVFGLLLILTGATKSIAQSYDPLQKPNSYATEANPHYWQNRKPFEGYWQQDVHYTLTANIDETNDRITGHEVLVYTNNSPDVLDFVYFHLYQNAFQPGSYYDNLLNNTDQPADWGEHESVRRGTMVKNLKVNGTDVRTELDNTILKVWLPTPLNPGQSCEFEMDFDTWFDIANSDRRMKTFNSFGKRHYDGVHWYPRISVYDRKFGWTTDQHLSREFYGDFGCFDVELTFSSNYIVGATGNLTNRAEMLPADLCTKLDIKNFANKPWNSAPSEIIPYNASERKTWIYHAENVHDFAFTADPNYRIGVAEWDGIKCYALVQEPHAAGWQNAAEYAAKSIEVFSRDFGRYTYHKMIVADARDGMEYPMLTLDGGFDPNYRGLFTHEIGHNWFFGQVGTNETYRAAMDEGFTQFLTVWALEAIDGDTLVVQEESSGYLRRYREKLLARDDEIYTDYIWDAARGQDPPLNVHSDAFNGDLDYGDGYWSVYNKTATMLYNLQYVLGDELFLAAMQNYFDQWYIAHPYPEDFRNSIIQFTHVDLNWFFDQWLETNKSVDYAVGRIKKDKNSNQPDAYVITFKRKGRMQMPIDFRVTAKDGKTYDYHIPNGWFEKQTEAAILPRWIGWDDLKPEYEARVQIPTGIENVEIDPSNRLADVYMLDNSKKLPVKYKFDSQVDNPSDWKAYEIFSRPELWWNGYDGVKVGLHVHGNYLEQKHRFEATGWLNTGFGQNLPSEFTNSDDVNNNFDNFSYRLKYSTSLDGFGKGFTFRAGLKDLDGLTQGSAGLVKTIKGGRDYLFVTLKAMYRDSSDLTYLLYPEQWQADRWNNTVNLRWLHKYDYVNGFGRLDFRLRASTLGSDYDYSQASLESINKSRVGKLYVNTRFFAQYGTGTSTPEESALYLAGANPESMMDNKYTRSVGFFDHTWFGYGGDVNHFQQGGGLNLRGYAGYLAPELDDVDSLRFTYNGRSGASASIEIDLEQLTPWSFGSLGNFLQLEYYVFGDVGVMAFNTPSEPLSFPYVRADAGVGFALTVWNWGALEKVRPLTVRCDFPLLINTAPAGTEHLALRYVVGINRSF